MAEILLGLMFLTIVASVLQANFKIPQPITLMTSIVVLKLFGFNMLPINDEIFDMLVIASMPLLISADTLKLKWDEIKEHGISLFWVACISVVFSVFAGVLIKNFVLHNYNIEIAGIAILFCMVSATDPVTVTAIFSNFKVPHKLKLLTEGESLFNDATALIIFSLAVISMTMPEKISAEFIVGKTCIVLGGALIIGGLIGLLTVFLLKLSSDALVEATILLLGSYSSYIFAEHFHFSGILSVICAMMVANKKIQEFLEKDDSDLNSANLQGNYLLLSHAITNKTNHKIMMNSIDFMALMASSAIFIAIASLINFEEMFIYWKEILSVFIASTVIRALMMLKFAIISHKTNKMQNINKKWWAVLTFAGSKGALSILMVHLIPNTFKYKQLFETIIIGNIILSIFVYALILALIFTFKKEEFENELNAEK